MRAGFSKNVLKYGTLTLIIITLQFLFTGCLFPKEAEVLAPPLKEPEQVEYDLIEVKKDIFEKKTTCTGYLVSVSQKDMTFQNISGRLKGVYVNIGDTVKKGDLLAELLTDNIESRIEQQEIQLERVQMAYDAAVAGGDSQYNIKNDELSVKLEKIKLEDLNKELAASKLVSSINGTVDYIADIREGAMVAPYQTIVTVADPKVLQIDYSGDKVSEFELGARVDLDMDDVVYKGTVVRTPSNVPLDADEKTKTSIRIKPDKLPGDAAIGDYTGITLMRDRKENVIVIPKDLVHTLGASKCVHVLESNLKKERYVEIGDENTTQYLITQGLSEGDMLIDD